MRKASFTGLSSRGKMFPKSPSRVPFTPHWPELGHFLFNLYSLIIYYLAMLGLS